jgi:hypothetical protein
MIKKVTDGDNHNPEYTYAIDGPDGPHWYHASSEEGVKVLLNDACYLDNTPTKTFYRQKPNFHDIITMYNRKKILESLDKNDNVLT